MLTLCLFFFKLQVPLKPLHSTSDLHQVKPDVDMPPRGQLHEDQENTGRSTLIINIKCVWVPIYSNKREVTLRSDTVFWPENVFALQYKSEYRYRWLMSLAS